MLQIIDLSQLPFPGVLEMLDFEELYAQRKSDLIAAYPPAASVLDLESDPLAKLLQENTYRELLLRQRINEAARAVMLAHSTGSDLDNLGALFDVRRLAGEIDNAFRIRIQQSMYRLSVAGPALAYESHARAAHDDIVDVDVSRPAPGDVLVCVLARDGQPGAEILERVESALNAETVRPLSDTVIVQPADIHDYSIIAEIETFAGPDGDVVLSAASEAVAAYVASTYKIGAAVTRSGIYAALRQPGVTNVTLYSPAPTSSIEDVLIESVPLSAPRCIGIDVQRRRQGA